MILTNCWWHVPVGTHRRDDSFWAGRGKAGSKSASVGFTSTVFWMDDLITPKFKVKSMAKTTSSLRARTACECSCPRGASSKGSRAGFLMQEAMKKVISASAYLIQRAPFPFAISHVTGSWWRGGGLRHSQVSQCEHSFREPSGLGLL